MIPIIRSSEAASMASLNVLVYGPSGAGKTYLARTTGALEQTLVVAAEPGLLTLRDVDIAVTCVTSIADLKRVYAYLRSGEHPYQWVVLDSLSEVAEVCLVAAQQTAITKQGKRDGLKAYGDMGETMIALVRAFRDLPLHVVMTAKQERIQDDQGRLVYVPSLPGRKLGQAVPYLLDEVLALRAELGEPDADGRPVVTRYLQTTSDGTYEAKDRSGRLAIYEPPDLARIHQQIIGGAS
ncbi:MAG: ATP-binding protein [Gemmatimonadales bacterium]